MSFNADYWRLFDSIFITLLLSLVLDFSFAQYPAILTQRDQGKVIDDLLEDRLRTLLPELMRREGFDMWVVISREYNEDPVIETLLPATWMAGYWANEKFNTMERSRVIKYFIED